LGEFEYQLPGTNPAWKEPVPVTTKTREITEVRGKKVRDGL